MVAVFAAATLAFFGISGNTVIQVDYELKTSDNVAEMYVHPPEELSVDIVELYCNGEEVTKTVLPNGALKSIPFVFTDLHNLELRFYKLSECIGVGNFKDDKLYVAVKDNALPEDYANEIEEVVDDEG